MYGSAITFYERVAKDTLSEEQCAELELNVLGDEKTVNINKCICLLSHWAFFDTFEKFLSYLYNMSCEGPHNVPIERSVFFVYILFKSIIKVTVVLYQNCEVKLQNSIFSLAADSARDLYKSPFSMFYQQI